MECNHNVVCNDKDPVQMQWNAKQFNSYNVFFGLLTLDLAFPFRICDQNRPNYYTTETKIHFKSINKTPHILPVLIPNENKKCWALCTIQASSRSTLVLEGNLYSSIACMHTHMHKTQRLVWITQNLLGCFHRTVEGIWDSCHKRTPLPLALNCCRTNFSFIYCLYFDEKTSTQVVFETHKEGVWVPLSAQANL